jgi:hypothetical protein
MEGHSVPGALVVTAQPAPPQRLTVADLKRNVATVQAAMRESMKEGVHYGQIPGTPKKTLYKAGAEVLCTMFLLGVDPEVLDLSDHDEFRYRVKLRLTHRPTSDFVGYGLGEASTDEDKYRWRKALCDAEFEAADPDRQRVKYKKKDGGGYFTEKQVRTNPADLANTVLKMAKKRALVDAVLTCTAASDIFDQTDDIPEEMVEEIYGAGAKPRSRPQRKSQQQPPPPQAGTVSASDATTEAAPERPSRDERRSQAETSARAQGAFRPPATPADPAALAPITARNMVQRKVRERGHNEEDFRVKFGTPIADLTINQINDAMKLAEAGW